VEAHVSEIYDDVVKVLLAALLFEAGMIAGAMLPRRAREVCAMTVDGTVVTKRKPDAFARAEAERVNATIIAGAKDHPVWSAEEEEQIECEWDAIQAAIHEHGRDP
jgi:hypothetical protein